MTTADEYVAAMERKAELTKAAGYDYAESKLSEAELLACVGPKRVLQYGRGILTGGEVDCLAMTGRLPW